MEIDKVGGVIYRIYKQFLHFEDIITEMTNQPNLMTNGKNMAINCKNLQAIEKSIVILRR